jgi:plasmid replication initiation protein
MKELIVKANAVIEASYRLSVMEQRIILSAISQIRRDQPVSDEVMYELSVSKLRDISGSKSNAIYADMKAAVNHLYERSITIEKSPNGEGSPTKKLKTRWIQSAIYSDEEGLIRLRFAKDILPYLNQLTTQFTSYSLKEVASLTSAYAYRLYELLVQYRDIGSREISLENLRRWLDLGEKYGAIYDLKKRVVDPAVKQINDSTPYRVKYTQKKSGRLVTHFIFEFILISDRPAGRNGTSKIFTKADLEKDSKLARPGESFDKALKRLNSEGSKSK